MKYTTIILLCFVSAYVLRKVLGVVFGPARHVHQLLAKYPDAEQTSVFLPSLPSSFWQMWRKHREIFAKIEEMKKQGWTYLRNSRSQDGRLTLRGATLHFIRTDDPKTRHDC
jgi:hypothetical protein